MEFARFTVTGTSENPVLTIEFGEMMEDGEYPFSICSHGMPRWGRSREGTSEANFDNIASLLRVHVVLAKSSGENDDLVIEFANQAWLCFENTPGYEALTIFDGEKSHYV